ncbi:hypothetical protein N9496_04130 [Akkermansiaceae bacterium]|nr:hypothetical protein [Akkermansiaceae bacterium]
MIQRKSIITRARRATAFFVVAFSMMTFPAMAAEKITPDQSLTYKEVSGVELKLHVFKPEGHQASDKRPAMFWKPPVIEPHPQTCQSAKPHRKHAV